MPRRVVSAETAMEDNADRLQAEERRRIKAFTEALETTPLDWNLDEVKDDGEERALHMEHSKTELKQILADAEAAQQRAKRSG